MCVRKDMRRAAAGAAAQQVEVGVLGREEPRELCEEHEPRHHHAPLAKVCEGVGDHGVEIEAEVARYCASRVAELREEAGEQGHDPLPARSVKRQREA